jgi:hypothetical protein
VTLHRSDHAAHGFSIGMMVELVDAELASVTTERVVAGGLKMETAAFASSRILWVGLPHLAPNFHF